jgi:hypothetical protein
MPVSAARFAVAASLLAFSACTAETGAPDTSRGSADSPMTMLVDQMQHGAPTRGGGMSMLGPTDWTRGQAPVSRAQGRAEDFGGAMRPMTAAGGESF